MSKYLPELLGNGGPPNPTGERPSALSSILGSDQFGSTLQAMGASLMSSPSNNPFAGFSDNLQSFNTMNLQKRAVEQDQVTREEEKARRAELANYAMSIVPANLQSMAQVDPESALRIWESMKPSGGESFTLGAGEVRFGPNGEIIAQGGPDMGDSFGYEKDLYAQYTAAPPVKQYQDVKSGFERVRSSASADSGVGDLGVVYGFMKMLDPGSVVREGEFATAENTSGVPEQVMGLYNRLISGERLTPAQRTQFVRQAEQLYGETASNLAATNDQFSTRAQHWQVDPSRFVVEPEVFEPYGAAAGAVDPLGIR